MVYGSPWATSWGRGRHLVGLYGSLRGNCKSIVPLTGHTQRQVTPAGCLIDLLCFLVLKVSIPSCPPRLRAWPGKGMTLAGYVGRTDCTRSWWGQWWEVSLLSYRRSSYILHRSQWLFFGTYTSPSLSFRLLINLRATQLCVLHNTVGLDDKGRGSLAPLSAPLCGLFHSDKDEEALGVEDSLGDIAAMSVICH
jgi:hypothetical protein